ncbi:hypothetical protein ACEPT7_08015 [Burkholderia ubonensis]|nr:hypothetical protein [Burkholderia ubonensis]
MFNRLAHKNADRFKKWFDAEKKPVDRFDADDQLTHIPDEFS